MSSEIDDLVQVALRDRADGPVEVEELLAGAARRGRRHRQKRTTLLATGAAAAATAAIMGVVSVLPRGIPAPPGTGHQPSATPVTTPSPQGRAAARPPVARPGDTNVLRLDVTDAEAIFLDWESGEGWERLDVSREQSWAGSFNAYRVTRADSESLLDRTESHGSEPLPGDADTDQVLMGATLYTLTRGGNEGSRWATVRWREEGAWLGARIVFDGSAAPESEKAAALHVAQWVVTDAAFRCAVDFRLGPVPTGTKMAGCRYTVGPQQITSGMRFRTPSGTFTLTVRPAYATDPFLPNENAGGRPVQVIESAAKAVFTDRGALTEAVLEWDQRMDREQVLDLLGGFTIVEDVADPLS